MNKVLKLKLDPKKATKDCNILSEWEKGNINAKQAMYIIEDNNGVEFGEVEVFIKWASGLGYLGRG